MKRALTTAAIAAVVFGLAGCGGETDDVATQTLATQTETVTTTTGDKAERVPPTRRTLVGRWKQFGVVLTVELKADSTFAIDARGDLEFPAIRGTYTLRGGTVRFTVLTSRICFKGETWVWKASLRRGTTEEFLHVIYTKGECGGESLKGERWLLTRVG